MNKTGKLIFAFNMITLFLGLIMIGVAAYVWVGFSKYSALISLEAIYTGFAAGIAVSVCSFMGAYGAYADKKAILFLYLFIVFAVFGLQVAAAVIMAQYQGTISKNSRIPTDEITNTFAIAANNMMASTYTTCCSGCGTVNVCNVKPEVPIDGPYCNATALTPECIYVYNCPVGEVCYKNSTGSTLPTDSVDISVCSGLKLIPYKNGTSESFIVGPYVNTTSMACGHGDPVQFKAMLYGFADSVFNYFVIVFGVLAGINGLILFCGTYIIVFQKRSMKD